MSLGYTNHRRSIRLSNYDYASNGMYFVTMCSYRKWSIFGKIINDDIQLNEWGIIVRDQWVKTGELRDHVTLDEFVIMPNHCHGIIMINAQRCRGTARCAPTDDTPTDDAPVIGKTVNHVPMDYSATVRPFGSMAPGSIPAIVRAFKSAVTRRINILRHTPAVPVWQRNYYERIIRNESELNSIRQYIRDNPKNWKNDEYL